MLDPLYTATYDLSINEKEFVKWLIDTRKYTDIVSDMLSSHVADTVSIFKRFGGNNQVFSLSLKQYFDKTNIGQTIKDYNTVVSKIRQLYRQFETERKQQLLDKFYNRTDDTDNIKPLTSDTNNSLIIDSSSDDIVTKLLRDILRSLIALPHNMRDFAFMIIDRLDSLDNTVNIVNDSGIAPLDDLWSYSQSDFDDDLNQFSADVAESQQLPVSYVSDINNNPLMPEKMLSDKDSLTVNIPNMSGFTVSDDFKSFSIIDESDKLFGSSIHDMINIFGVCLLAESKICGINTKNLYYKRKDAIIDYLMKFICEADDPEGLQVVFLTDANVLNYTGIYVKGISQENIEKIYKSNQNKHYVFHKSFHFSPLPLF